jgi:hypothetical protein
MGAGFTPGPWDRRGLTVFEHGKTGLAIAVATQHERNAKANAALIAAAPGIYEALRTALNALIVHKPDWPDTIYVEAIEVAEAALAKVSA